MFKLIFLILLTLKSLSPLAKPLDDLWQLSRQTDNVWIWKHKDNSDVIGTLQSMAKVKPINWQKIKSTKFFKNLIKRKKRMLSLIGITDWKEKSHDWKKKKDYHELVIKGSYLNPKRERVQFIEHHLYFKNKTHQILLTFPKNKNLRFEIANQFIESIKGMVEK